MFINVVCRVLVVVAGRLSDRAISAISGKAGADIRGMIRGTTGDGIRANAGGRREGQEESDSFSRRS